VFSALSSKLANLHYKLCKIFNSHGCKVFLIFIRYCMHTQAYNNTDQSPYKLGNQVWLYVAMRTFKQFIQIFLFSATILVDTMTQQASAVPCTCLETVNCCTPPCLFTQPCYKANTECVDAYCKGCNYYYKNTVTGQVAYEFPRTCDP